MKTLDELRGMTQEDLVRLVQELEENLQKKEESVKYWMTESSRADLRMKSLEEVIRKLSTLI